MINTHTHPQRDTVLYDGHCRFCRGQIAILRRFDLAGSLCFTSLHDASVAEDFPEIGRDELLERMHVVDPLGRARGGAEAVRYLSRRLPLLWPLAVLLHIPGTLPLWNRLYAFIARHRLRIAGTIGDGGCDEGTCRLP
jgi:predicted DCC family thiol-disulfide oxidoreductase YuxK